MYVLLFLQQSTLYSCMSRKDPNSGVQDPWSPELLASRQPVSEKMASTSDTSAKHLLITLLTYMLPRLTWAMGSICQQVPDNTADFFYSTMFDVDFGIPIYSAYVVRQAQASLFGTAQRGVDNWRQEDGKPL